MDLLIASNGALVGGEVIGNQLEMERVISSGWTLVYKYAFPAVWIPAFGAVVVDSLQRPTHDFKGGPGGVAPASVGWMVLLVWLAASAFIVWLALPLKRVRVADGALLVSNGLREWRVPFGAIEGVAQNRWINLRPITVRLRADFGFGSRFTFLPPSRFMRWRFWREDPVVAELRALAGVTTT